MKYFFIVLFLIFSSIVFSQSREARAKEIEKLYVSTDENINELTFNELSDNISYYTNREDELIKLTTTRNGNIEYYLYTKGSAWPILVHSNEGGKTNLFFFDTTNATSRLFYWTANSYPENLDKNKKAIAHEADFFEAGRNFKIQVENAKLEEDISIVNSYLDSLKSVSFKPSVGTYELKDTIVTDDFDETTTSYSSTSYDSTYISLDANVSLRKEYENNEFDNTRISKWTYKDLAKNTTVEILTDEKLENSYRLRDKTATKTEITKIKLGENRCYKSSQLTKDYVTFFPEWERIKCN